MILKYTSLKQLRKALDMKIISSEELVLTYIHQSATIGMEHNALADIMFSSAIKQAKK
jgi:Asp-tRNA(Asn)/Glu-tRNA(Gln) amidotransferase A subunit family amidase